MYVGMKREFVPLCVENNLEVDILNDSHIGVCNISNKRTDAIHGAGLTEQVLLNNSDFLKVVEAAPCILNGSHGGLLCEEGTTLLFVQWMLDTKEDFTDAKLHCGSSGKILFDDVDDLEARLSDFVWGMLQQPFWIGLERVGLCWKDQTPQLLGTELNLNWADGEAEQLSSDLCVVADPAASGSNGGYLRNVPCEEKQFFVCNLVIFKSDLPLEGNFYF